MNFPRPMNTDEHNATTELAALGFQPGKGRTKTMRYPGTGLCLTRDAGWIVLEETVADDGLEPMAGDPDVPGLWKRVQRRKHGVTRRFDCPLHATDNDVSPVQMAVSWALATRGGAVPGSWDPPSEDTLASAIPEKGLTLHAGAFARQGRLCVFPHRVAVVFPVVVFAERDLSAFRCNWLQQVLREAQGLWKMVRFKRIHKSHVSTIEAEVDLTAAPVEMIADLVKTAIATLHGAVNWVLEPVELLVGKDSDLRALEAEAAKWPTQMSGTLKGGEDNGKSGIFNRRIPRGGCHWQPRPGGKGRARGTARLCGGGIGGSKTSAVG